LNLIAFALSLALLFSASPASAEDLAWKNAYNLYLHSCQNSLNPKTRALAIQQITEALRKFPNNPQFLYQKAYYLSISEEDDEDVLKLLEKALALNCKDAAALALKSEVMLRNGKPSEALEYAKKATSIDARYFMSLVRSLEKMKRYDEAFAECSKYLKKYPNCGSLLATHSELARQSKQWQTVIDDETKLLKLTTPKDNSHFVRLKKRASAYRALGQYDKAIIDFEFAMKKMPMDRQAPMELLDIYKTRKDAKNVARIDAYIRDLDEEIKP